MTLLWLGKETSAGTGGDDIYEIKTKKALDDAGRSVTSLFVPKVSRARRIFNFLTGKPYYRELYFQPDIAAKVTQMAPQFESVIISWEPMDIYALYGTVQKTLILHNVTSDAVRQIFPGRFLANLLSRYARIWEAHIYNSDKVRSIVVLSKRDRDIVQEIAPKKPVFVAPPGAPPATDLSPAALLRCELVISGTFDWFPKKRDMQKFDREFAEAGLTYPVLTDGAQIGDGDVRFGVITDRFAAGHKLKTMFYIANNCVVLSYCDVSSDFEDLPFSSRFIRRVENAAQLNSAIQSLKEQWNDELCGAFSIFKSACLARFSWKNTAAEIEEALEVGKPR